MSHRTVLAAAILVSGLVAYAISLESRLAGLTLAPASIIDRTAKSLAEIDSAKSGALRSVREGLSSELQAAASQVTAKQLAAYERQLTEVTKQVAARQEELQAATANLERAQEGLPSLIELDQLNEHYATILEGVGRNEAVATFNTSVGQLAFQKTHFSLARVPSSARLAFLRIGKDDSAENAELVKAWLGEAAAAKTRMGYVLQFQRTRPSDYGETTEALYQNGDSYFKTHLQYQRVLETYGRHSLQYTYYVEIGSESRREQYELEEYNRKLGS